MRCGSRLWLWIITGGSSDSRRAVRQQRHELISRRQRAVHADQRRLARLRFRLVRLEADLDELATLIADWVQVPASGNLRPPARAAPPGGAGAGSCAPAKLRCCTSRSCGTSEKSLSP